LGAEVILGKGTLEGTLSREDVSEIVGRACDELRVESKRVLTIIPDRTRTMPMPLLFELLQQNLSGRAKAHDYLVALGTHQLMTDVELSEMIGCPVRNGVCGNSKILNHRWDIPETFVDVGVIPASEVATVSNGLLSEEIVIRVNRLIFDYDQVLICGPVFPHEVVGFSGGNKYLFPGISGSDMINQTHWLGALLGSYNIIGTQSTPVRELIDRAAAQISVPISCLALVVSHKGASGIYFGNAVEAWKAAAELSSQKHIHWIDKPFQRVLSVMPELYRDMWTAAKGMYKAEPAIADGGEVIIYAPQITEFSYTHGSCLEQVGYHCRDYFLKQWSRFSEVPRGVLAHSTHLKGQGTYDAATGVETSRIQVTLATGISEERCRAMNLGYLDPKTLNLDDWRNRENEGIKLIPRAGEALYRVRTSS
jgi:nickel-dependent lactate racemase